MNKTTIYNTSSSK